MRAISPARSLSTAGCPGPSTASRPSAGARSRNTWRTWKPSSKPSRPDSNPSTRPGDPPPTTPFPTSASPPVSTVCVSDADLVARARLGDSAAFGELVDRHRTAVYRATRAALTSHADAEDAAQEAFLVAY